MTYYRRKAWGARPARSGPGPLDVDDVTGIALHWPGINKPLTTVPAVMAALRGWQNYHMDDKGWSDLAYQEAIDQAGNVYEGRGLRVQSGANGDTVPNQTNGALLLILAPGEEPTPAMIAAVRRRVARHQHLFRKSKSVRTHNDVRPEPTQCPGPAATRLVREGAFNPRGNR